jgi:hypothetical protein
VCTNPKTPQLLEMREMGGKNSYLGKIREFKNI